MDDIHQCFTRLGKTDDFIVAVADEKAVQEENGRHKKAPVAEQLALEV
ncbi:MULTISPECIES: hypothetical protein [Methylomonas]|nr:MULTISPECIES: hypothetical protein [Methylomonas]WNB77237.1 hypothetical protein RI210_06595 [Methylomonas koyamae]